MILALDISTSITGITVMKDGNIIKNGIVDTRNKNKFSHINEVADEIEREIKNLVGDHEIKKIIIEEPLNKFQSGASSATVLSTLSKINGIVCYISEKLYGVRPELISASTARKVAGIKIQKKSELGSKNQVLAFVENNFDFHYDLTRSGKPKPGTYDRADSIVLALAAQKMLDGDDLKS